MKPHRVAVQTQKIAIIGCGDLARRTLLPGLQSAEGRHRFALACVWSPLREDCRMMVEGVPGARIARCLEDVLEDSSVETVWILSPATAHASQTLAALAAGKHVYVQKPLATTLAEVDAIVTATDRTGKFVCAAPAVMDYPTIRLVREQLLAGRLGPLFAVSAPFMGWGGKEIEWPGDPAWRFQPGNGPLRDHGIYTLTILQALLGNPVRVSALGGVTVAERTWRGSPIAVTEPDNFAVILEFAHGVLVTLNEAWCAGGAGYHFRFFGLEGSLETLAGSFEACPRGFVIRDIWGTEQMRVDASSHPEIGVFFSTVPCNTHVWRDVCDLADCIEAGRDPGASPRKIRPVYQTLEAIYRSISERRVIEMSE